MSIIYPSEGENNPRRLMHARQNASRREMYRHGNAEKPVRITLPDVADPFGITLTEWNANKAIYIDMGAQVEIKHRGEVEYHRLDALQQVLF